MRFAALSACWLEIPYGWVGNAYDRGMTVSTRATWVRNSAMKLLRKVAIGVVDHFTICGEDLGRVPDVASGAVICRALQKLRTPRKLC
jgi:hypothetical protein